MQNYKMFPKQKKEYRKSDNANAFCPLFRQNPTKITVFTSKTKGKKCPMCKPMMAVCTKNTSLENQKMPSRRFTAWVRRSITTSA